jgi:DNA-binding XRE family transcriptional regulator
MNIKKYFWSLNPKALKEVKSVLSNINHPRFIERAFTLLSRCDDPKIAFSAIHKEQFVKMWPKLRQYWIRTGQAADFSAWWETVYEELIAKGKSTPPGKPSKIFLKIGKRIKEARTQQGISQLDFARRAGMRQPDISAIEAGKKNITLATLIRLCRIVGVLTLDL